MQSFTGTENGASLALNQDNNFACQLLLKVKDKKVRTLKSLKNRFSNVSTGKSIDFKHVKALVVLFNHIKALTDRPFAY